MRFCNKCFADKEVQSVIESLGQHSDECETCGRRDVYIYDTDINSELVGLFEELINVYTPARLLPERVSRGELNLIKDELADNWHIFHSKLSKTKIYNIVKSICAENYAETPELFDAPVGIAERYDSEELILHSLLYNYTWEEFVESLKFHNRFHSRHMNLKLFEQFCSFIRKGYKQGTIFYRARISPEVGFSPDEMGAPPVEKTVAGRANSAGIQCFYLASDLDTAIHEVRAGAFDYITVAHFELLEDIVVVNLNAIDKISPFVADFDYLEHAINKGHLQRINAEMGKALRRSDSSLDYIPTQYICDFIKSIQYGDKSEYAGIEYHSTIHPAGVNLALFEPFPAFRCVGTEVYRISELEYKKEKV